MFGWLNQCMGDSRSDIENAVGAPSSREDSLLTPEFIEGLERVRARANESVTWEPDREIHKVVMIVIVEAEVRPILDEYKMELNQQLTDDLLNLATAYSATVGSFRLDVLKVAEDPVHKRHYSGPSQSAGIAALIAKVIKPDLVVNFGTAGGFPSASKVGDVLLIDSCLILDRLRFKTVSAFEWGLYGGPCVKSDKMRCDLGLTLGTCASKIDYSLNDVKFEIARRANISCVDMECGAIGQIFGQTKTNFLVLKVISDVIIYPPDPKKQEEAYHMNREEVSRVAAQTLRKLFAYLDGKKVADMA